MVPDLSVEIGVWGTVGSGVVGTTTTGKTPYSICTKVFEGGAGASMQ